LATTRPSRSPSSDYEADRTYYDFSPRVNLSYTLNDDMMVYGGYSQGWKAGSFDPRGENFADAGSGAGL
jgi:iron complex outermembrane receptor protein